LQLDRFLIIFNTYFSQTHNAS